MKDEIKEMNLPKEIEEAFSCIDYELSVCSVCNDKLAKIFNYITNLQKYYNDNVTKYEELILKYSNLQKENEKLKQFYDKKGVYSLEYNKETLSTMICELQEENENLIEEINNIIRIEITKKELQERIEKADKWIDNHIETYTKSNITIIDWDTFANPMQLKNILQGVGKDV